MKAVAAEQEQGFFQKYPIIYVNDLDVDPSVVEFYESFTISAHDRFLNDEEADKLTLSYQVESSDRDHYFKKEQLFIDSLVELKERYEIFLFLEDYNEATKRDIGQFYEFDSTVEFVKVLQSNFREMELITLCLPYRNILMVGSQDLNLVVYHSKGENISDVVSAFVNNGLHLLHPST